MWSGACLKKLANKDLKWQTTKQYNLGLEASFFKNKLNLNANFYYKRTDDLISTIELPESKGFKEYIQNMGILDNKGVELSVGTVIFNKEKLYCSISAGLTYNENTIIKISKNFSDQIENKTERSKDSKTLFSTLREGHASDALFVVRSLGIDPISGNEVFKRFLKDKDGNILMNEKGEKLWIPSFDRTFSGVEYAGIENPPYRGNINTHFTYGRWELNLSFGFNWGAKVFNKTLFDRIENSNIDYNVDKRVKYNRWEKIGDRVAYKKINGYDGGITTFVSSRFVQSKSEFVCRNVNLTYKIENNDWIKKNMGLKVLSFSFNMSEIFYISSIKRERGTSYPFSHKALFRIRARF
jgi:hypothetical protein